MIKLAFGNQIPVAGTEVKCKIVTFDHGRKEVSSTYTELPIKDVAYIDNGVYYIKTEESEGVLIVH